jgi:hypothetical protein
MDDDGKLQAVASKSGRPSGTCSGGYVEIDAPIETVWSIVGDWRGWGAWNPLYTHTAGEPREGAEVDMTVSLSGMKPLNVRATVKVYRAPTHFEYGLSQMGGLVKAHRFIELEELAPGRCSVANGEIMSGPVGWLLARIAGGKVGDGLKAMNAKLKELAEAKAQQQTGS